MLTLGFVSSSQVDPVNSADGADHLSRYTPPYAGPDNGGVGKLERQHSILRGALRKMLHRSWRKTSNLPPPPTDVPRFL